MSELYKSFGESLKEHLEKNNRTQRELADYLGVSETSVSRWVNGGKMPRMNKIDSICEYLHCTRTEIFGLSQQEMDRETSEYLYTVLAEKEGITADELKKAVEIVKSFRG